MIYECEYLSKEKTLNNSRLLWCIDKKSEGFSMLPKDPAFEEADDSSELVDAMKKAGFTPEIREKFLQQHRDKET